MTPWLPAMKGVLASDLSSGRVKHTLNSHRVEGGEDWRKGDQI